MSKRLKHIDFIIGKRLIVLRLEKIICILMSEEKVKQWGQLRITETW